jgi:flagellar export protein FliJ
VSRFRLATLERLREQQEQICARRLRESMDELTAAQARREELTAQLESTASARLAGDQLVMAALFRDRIREDILASTSQISRCEAMLAQARDAWKTAKAQLRAVQSLHDRHHQAVRAAVARAEQAELDEFAGTRGHAHRAVIGGTA